MSEDSVVQFRKPGEDADALTDLLRVGAQRLIEVHERAAAALNEVVTLLVKPGLPIVCAADRTAAIRDHSPIRVSCLILAIEISLANYAVFVHRAPSQDFGLMLSGPLNTALREPGCGDIGGLADEVASRVIKPRNFSLRFINSGNLKLPVNYMKPILRIPWVIRATRIILEAGYLSSKKSYDPTD